MTPPRLRRLLPDDTTRILDVAVDHGFFGEGSLLRGIEDITAVIPVLVGARPHAIQLAPGPAARFAALGGIDRPELILRVDIANVYGNPLDRQLFSTHIPNAIEHAVRLDAAAVCVNLISAADEPSVRASCIDSILTMREHADRLGMPMMVEPLAMKKGGNGESYATDDDLASIVPLVRQAAELGADLIKADVAADLDNYHRVIEAASGVPVLVRGGSVVDDATMLRRAAGVLASGARGLVFGRNVVQHPHPAAIVAALLAVLEGATPDEALVTLEEARNAH